MSYKKRKDSTEDIYFCKKCSRDSEGDEVCPCPRGYGEDCEAEIVGEKTTKYKYIDNEI